MSVDDARERTVVTGATGAVALAGEVAAAAVVFHTSPTTVTNVRSGPSTSYSVVAQLAPNSAVTILCQTQGGQATGPYGTSTIWDRIGSGRYVSDACVNTGSDGYVTGQC